MSRPTEPNCFTWYDPPGTEADLQIWKIYVSTCNDNTVWGKVQRWLKMHGNPFQPDRVMDVDNPQEDLYFRALVYCMDIKK